MNDRNFDQLLNAWMDLGPTTAPDRVADAARLEAAATRQLPAALSRWAPRRFPVMNTTAKVILATAAVVFAALLGYNYLVAPNVGGPRLFVPGADFDPVPKLEVGAGRLPPGGYQITDFDPSASPSPSRTGGRVMRSRRWSGPSMEKRRRLPTSRSMICSPIPASMEPSWRSGQPSTTWRRQSPGSRASRSTRQPPPPFPGSAERYRRHHYRKGLSRIRSTHVEDQQPGSIDRPYPGRGSGFQQYLILDVNGERLVIASQAPSGAPSVRRDEAMSIVNSTVIEAP